MEEKILLEEFSDQELLNLVEELSGETFAEDSLPRKLSVQLFGEGESLVKLVGVSHFVLKEMSKRFKVYSPHINPNGNSVP